MTGDWDFSGAFDRLSQTMGWDEIDPGPAIEPPAISPPRPIPPARTDQATIARRNRALNALARIRGRV